MSKRIIGDRTLLFWYNTKSLAKQTFIFLTKHKIQRMKTLMLMAFLIGGFHTILSQEIETTAIDSLYKEDQFYAGITYNLVSNTPNNFSQQGFSTGFSLGFIKDMPINKQRNIAIAVGFGYGLNTFNQNILVSKNSFGQYEYSILSGSDTYSKNKFTTHMLELPIEFRWRTSTPTQYDFWRIYAGFKLGYTFANTTKHVGDLGAFKHHNVAGFNNFQYGLTLSAGYNTWNIHLYYALNSIFKDDVLIDGTKTDLNAVKLGLMFYIL